MTDSKPARPDWERIEAEYRAGSLSVREIARQAGLTEGAIRKRAKAEGWERDLTEKVRKAARAKLVRELSTQERRTSDRETVESASSRQVEVVRQHQHAIGRGRNLTVRLLDELDATTAHIGEMEAEIVAETRDDKNGTRRAAMLRAVSLPGRAGVIRDLSTAAKNWVALERQAFGIDDRAPGDSPADGIAKILHEIDGRTRGLPAAEGEAG